MMTTDKKFIAFVKPLQILNCRNFCKFAVCSAITIRACQHKIPNTVQVYFWHQMLKCMWKEMVYIAGVILIIRNNDIIKTIKTFSFLITVESSSGRCNIFSFELFINEKDFGLVIIADI